MTVAHDKLQNFVHIFHEDNIIPQNILLVCFKQVVTKLLFENNIFVLYIEKLLSISITQVTIEGFLQAQNTS